MSTVRLQDTSLRPLEIIAWVALAVYAIGILPALSLGYLAWFSVATKTLANSQGGISLSFQMASLILLTQFVVAQIPPQRPNPV